VMPDLKAGWLEPEKKMEKRIKPTSCVIGGKVVGRFDPDNAQPNDRREPRLPNSSSRFLQWLILFHCIIRSFAGNHDVMNMAFAKACNADADETRFLQQLRNRRASAIPHARFQPAHHLVNDHRY
jgi:hypothetical protein